MPLEAICMYVRASDMRIKSASACKKSDQFLHLSHYYIINNYISERH